MSGDVLPEELLGEIYAFVDDDLAKDVKGRLMGAAPDAPLSLRLTTIPQEILEELDETLARWKNVWINAECAQQVIKFLGKHIPPPKAPVVVEDPPKTTPEDETAAAAVNGEPNGAVEPPVEPPANPDDTENPPAKAEPEEEVEEPVAIRTPLLQRATLDLAYYTRMDLDLPPGLDSRIWPHLTIFNITCNSISPYLDLIPNTVVHLSVTATKLDSGEFRQLAEKCPNMETLYLSINKYNEFSPQRGYELPPLPELKQVTLGDNGLALLLQALSASAPKLRSLIWKPRSLNSTFESRKNRFMSFFTKFTRVEIDSRPRGSAKHIPGDIPFLLSFCPYLDTLVVYNAPSKTITGSPDRYSLYDRRKDSAKVVTQELSQALTSPQQYCPLLSTLELHNMPFDVEYLHPLIDRLVYGAVRGGCSPRLIFRGCGGISSSDCQNSPVVQIFLE